MFKKISVMLVLLVIWSGFSWSGAKTNLNPISIYDEDNLLELSIEDAGKYHGDICPCLVVGFRAIQLAISQLWGNEIPRREDFKIISALPGQGAQDAFEFITRVKTRKDFELNLPDGTSIADLSLKNWAFTFIRKSNEKQVNIWLKNNAFPEGPEKFFELRKKTEFNESAILKNKEKFKLAKQEFKKRLIKLPLSKLFGVKKGKSNEKN